MADNYRNNKHEKALNDIVYLFSQNYFDNHCVDDVWVLFDCSPENVLIMESNGKVGAFHYVITNNHKDSYCKLLCKLLDYDYDGIEIIEFSGEETLSNENNSRWFFMVKAKGKYGMFEMFCKDCDTGNYEIELKELMPCIYDKIEFEEYTVRLFFNNEKNVRSVSWKDVGKLTALECGEVFEYYAWKALDMG